MSGLDAYDDDAVTPGASWRALSGDAPQAPPLGQWQNPYAQQQPLEQPPYTGAEQALVEQQPVPAEALPALVPDAETVPEKGPESTIVPVEQLEPVGPPRYLAPQLVARDPRQRTMAAVITFVALLIGLWGILGFMGSLTKALTAVNSGNAKLRAQMTTANAGLVKLDEKTRPLHEMTVDTATLGGLLSSIDSDMGTMLEGVDQIAVGMTTMGESLDTLDSELSQVNDINASMSTQLGSINTGLEGQLSKVRTMRRDVQATGTVLGTLPGRLNAVNGRLGHVNNAVNIMGCTGITNNLKVKIKAGPISTGTATVYATVVPPAAWGVKADGVTPC